MLAEWRYWVEVEADAALESRAHCRGALTQVRLRLRQPAPSSHAPKLWSLR